MSAYFFSSGYGSVSEEVCKFIWGFGNSSTLPSFSDKNALIFCLSADGITVYETMLICGSACGQAAGSSTYISTTLSGQGGGGGVGFGGAATTAAGASSLGVSFSSSPSRALTM